MSFVEKWFGFGRNPHYDEGVRAYERGEFEVAIELFKVCIASDPEPSTRDRAKNYVAGSLGRLAREDIALRDFASAEARLTEALQMRPTYADLRRQLAYANTLDGRFEAAASELEQALALNPNYGRAKSLLAALELKTGKPEVAFGLAERACQDDPRLDRATLAKARAAFVTDPDEAFALLRDWDCDQKTSIDSLMAEADALMKRRRWAEAEQGYRDLVDRQPRYADVRVKHGQALLELDQVDLAANEFREAIALNERFALAHALLGIALRRQGDEDAALDSFRFALDIEADQPIASAELMRVRA